VAGSAPRWSWHTASHRRVHDPELRGRRHRRGVDALAARGADFERYDGLAQDERGVVREKGPYIAWFKDPSGNVLSVLQEK
jgi:hypothetical protein